MLQAALGLVREKVIMPAIYFNNGPDKVKKEIKSEFARLNLSFDSKRFDLAYSKAWEALISFHHELKRIGKKTLENLGEKRAIVVVGRPYSAYDSRTNLNLFYTFSRLGAIAIPQEFLDLDEEEIESDYPNMYWGFGDKILKAAKAINKDHRLFGLYLTSFACGPDSFILHFFNHEMARTNRPYLELELDEHSAGAGVETRLLAFLDVLKNQRNVQVIDKSVNIIPKKTSTPLSERTLYIPKMAEGSRCLAAAFQGVGHKAEVMPTYTKEGLEFAKSATSGKECFPCTVTTGDMFDLINTLKEKQNKVGEEIAFFMPETEGPCRFGQYNRLHRILLDRLGLDQIPILSPSSEDSYRC
ncbi:CoA activase, partial [bacterium]|nr:CoA activase [bacterium]